MPLCCATAARSGGLPVSSRRLCPGRCRAVAAQGFPSFLPAEAEELEEPAARELLRRVELLPVQLGSASLPTAVVRTSSRSGGAPLLLLHGFDSSLLELRRLFPLLESSLPQHSVFAPDLLGCGFTGTGSSALAVSPESRRAHLYAFWQQYVGEPMVLVGASLGGAVSADFALHHPEAVRGLVLVDAQLYTEGTPALPSFLEDAGLEVLRSTWLRGMANQMAYSDKALFATEDALRCGRLHTFQAGWKQNMSSFMSSGGYKLSKRVAEIRASTLVVWGAQDGILEPANASRLQGDLARCSGLVMIDNCGHCAHLERPNELRDAVVLWLPCLANT